jgi:hypothetical protein
MLEGVVLEQPTVWPPRSPALSPGESSWTLLGKHRLLASSMDAVLILLGPIGFIP